MHYSLRSFVIYGSMKVCQIGPRKETMVLVIKVEPNKFRSTSARNQQHPFLRFDAKTELPSIGESSNMMTLVLRITSLFNYHGCFSQFPSTLDR